MFAALAAADRKTPSPLETVVPAEPRGVRHRDDVVETVAVAIANGDGSSKLGAARTLAGDAAGVGDHHADVRELHLRQEGQRQATVRDQSQHHERAEFSRIDGRWFYIDGEMIKAKPVVREAPKVGRNEPCPCGSGKKYKKCCGR